MEVMLLGLAIGIALFAVLMILTQVLVLFTKSEYEVYWNETIGWFCVFAAAGASIGYIVGVFV